MGQEKDDESDVSIDDSKKDKKKLFSEIFSENSSFRDRCPFPFVIRMDNSIYGVWKMFVIFCCIFSSYMYGYLAAFKVPEPGTTLSYLDLSFYVIFAIDMIVCK